jgi:predicted nucleic acid-binding protein
MEEGSSLRDQMKDEIHEYLMTNSHEDISRDAVAGLADIVFQVLHVSDAEQDRPYESRHSSDFHDLSFYDQMIPSSLAKTGIDLINLLEHPQDEYLIGISNDEEVVSVFNANEEFLGMLPF